MEEIISFLRNIYAHNDREWFNAHKEEYLSVKKMFDGLVESLIADVQGFDDSIGALTPADCTWRIYRDTRFSNDKRPYKTQMGCFFAPGGKRGPFSGYYFQVGISDEDGSVVGMIATGNYYTEPGVLKVLREDIALDEGRAFMEALRRAEGFCLDSDSMLKRMPRGYEADKPYSKFFLYRNFCLMKSVDVKYLLSKRFAKNLVDDFRSTQDFLSYLNRAIQFSLEEGY